MNRARRLSLAFGRGIVKRVFMRVTHALHQVFKMLRSLANILQMPTGKPEEKETIVVIREGFIHELHSIGQFRDPLS